ncbi:MAG: glycosyltransferase family 39 protein [Bacteroidales bacterium]|nr:glycosyltransferase family 39 protein [Bacteroidales bacterium]
MLPNKHPKSKTQNKQEPVSELHNEKQESLSFSLKEPYVYLLLFLFTFILYANTFRHQWALDDTVVCKKNAYVEQGFKGFKQILTTHSMEGVNINPEAYQYRPLSLLMFATEWQLSPDNPSLHHIINVIWYALACVLLYIVLRKMFVDKSKLLPFIITVLYTAHPMHTEVVANIKGRDDIILWVFVLLSIWFSLQYIDKKNIKYLIGLIVAFGLAIFSKESAITFLAAIPLTVYFFRKAKRKEFLYLSICLLLPILTYLLVRAIVLNDYPTAELSTANNYLAEQTLLARWASAIMLLGKYLLLLIFPYQQVCDYSFNQLPVVTFMHWKSLLPLGIYIALIVYAIKHFRTKHPLSYCIFFFIITMSIYSNLLYLIGASFADRFLFVPSLGYCIAIVYLLYTYADKHQQANPTAVTKPQLISMGLILIMLLYYTVQTHSRSVEWENNFTLYGADIKKSPNSARLNFFWGEALRDKANEYQDLNNNATNPNEIEKNALKYRAYLWESIIYMQKGLNTHPNHANAYDRIGYAYYSLHPFYRNQNFLDSAIHYYDRALQLHPHTIITQYNIAIAYYNKGEYEKAKNHYLYVLRADTSENVVHFDVGSSYAMLGQLDSARYHFDLYIRQHPEGATTCYYNLAIAYARINALDSAIAMGKRTLQGDPYNISSYQLMIQIYAYQQQSEKAFQTVNAMIAHMPEKAAGYMEKATLFRQLNQPDSANYYYELGKTKQP